MEAVIPKLRALPGMTIVQPIEEKEIKQGNIIIPTTAKLVSIEGVIVSIGEVTTDKGVTVDLGINVGDVVIYDPKSSDPIEVDGIKYLFVPYEALLAVKVPN